MGKLHLMVWQIDAPCHTYGCYNRIMYKLTPEEFRDVSAGAIAGFCEECLKSMLECIGENGRVKDAPPPPPITWVEVDKFLRAHRKDDIAQGIVEGAMNLILISPRASAPDILEAYNTDMRDRLPTPIPAYPISKPKKQKEKAGKGK